MHSTVRATVATGVAIVAVLAFAGCSLPSTPTAEATATTMPTSSPTASADSAPTTVDFGAAPDTAGLPACSAVLPDDLGTALVPGVRAVDVLRDTPHLGGTEAFVAASGGLVCLWSNGVAPLDDHFPGKRGESVFEGIRLSVLPDARDALRQYEDATGPNPPTACSASDSARVFCGADVRAGDAWVSLASTRVQDDQDATPEQAQPAFDALRAAVVEQVAASSLGTAQRDGSDDAAITPCDVGNVNAVTDTDLAVGPFPNSSTPPELEDFARNRVGGDACVFVGGSGDYPTAEALYTRLPDGGWLAEQRLDAGTVSASDRLDLDGLGDRDAAWRTCDDTACTVDVVRDGDWTHFVLFSRVAADTSDAIERWVASASD